MPKDGVLDEEITTYFARIIPWEDISILTLKGWINFVKGWLQSPLPRWRHGCHEHVAEDSVTSSITWRHQVRASPCCSFIHFLSSSFLPSAVAWTLTFFSLFLLKIFLPSYPSPFFNFYIIWHYLNANLWFLNLSVGGLGRMFNVDAHPERTVTSFIWGPFNRRPGHWHTAATTSHYFSCYSYLRWLITLVRSRRCRCKFGV